MKKISIVFALLVFLTLASCGSGDKIQNPISSTESQTDALSSLPVYSESELTDASNVIFFHADWCSKCRSAEKKLAGSDLPENINLLKADFDTSLDLREKYGVTSQHTFVQVDAQGNELAKWYGSKSVKDIQENIVFTPGREEPLEEVQQEVQEVVDELPQASTPSIPEQNVITSQVVETQEVIALGTYTQYAPELVGSTDKTVLFFHADWCPTCVRLEKDILSGSIPSDLTILKVDYDNATDLKKQYGVTGQTTLVSLDSNGNMIKKWVGGDLESIISMAEQG